MNKLLIVSDSHGDKAALKKAFKKEEGVTMILHAGDYYSDAYTFEELKPDLSVYCVCGNCDRSYVDQDESMVIEIGLSRIFLTHGHRFDVKYTIETLLEEALRLNCNLCVFGHTHAQMLENHRGVLMLNPGTVSKSHARRGSPSGYGVIDLDEDGDIIGAVLRRW
jgi:putative phosphoesterase